MNELDTKILQLYATNSIVNKAFQSTDNETEALKLAVVTLASSLEATRDAIEKKPASFVAWEISGNLSTCPECLKIREVNKISNLEKFEDLKGQVLTGAENKDNNQLIFTLEDGDKYCLHHDQDCCENVRIDDINGNLDDLIGAPILLADEAMSTDNPTGIKIPEYQDSFTWTFYRLATVKGYVTIRWYGESNGYYSERVNFRKLENN